MKEKIVYHYCGVETFLNIIRNHTLRLSDLCSSTDNMELKCLLDMVKDKVIDIYEERKEFVDSVIYGMERDDAFIFLLQTEIEKMKAESEQLLYGICFSEEGDLLGQWREYGDRGRGVSIGFKTEWFERLCEKDRLFKFSKVLYNENEEETLSKIIRYAEMIYEGIIDVIGNFKTCDILNNPYGASYYLNLVKREMYADSVFIKRVEYAEEKEWRLIIDDEETRKNYDDWETLYNWKDISLQREIKDTIYELLPNALEFTVKNNKIVSFLDLKYDIDVDNMPIQKIIIGPNCKVSESDIFFLLEFFGLDGKRIETQRSKSSYRN